MITEEFKSQFRADELDVSELREVSLCDQAARDRRSATISQIQADRQRPRSAKSRDMVPAHIREQSVERWAAEDREWLKGIAWEASLRGRLRMWVKKAVGI